MHSRRCEFKALVGRVSLGVVLCGALFACEWPRRFIPTSQMTDPATLVCNGSFTEPDCIGVSVVVMGNVSLTLAGDGVSVSGATGFGNSVVEYVGLKPGTYTVSGTMSGSTIDVYLGHLGSYAAGGVGQYLIENAGGPFVGMPQLCQLSYSTAGKAPPPQPFSFTFVVGPSAPFC